MIKNIVFDVGQVMMYYTPALYINRLGIYDEEDIKILIKEVFDSAEWCATDSGRLSSEEAAKIVSKQLPAHLVPAAEPLMAHWWEGEITPVPGIEPLIRELKSLNYGIYMLSNASQNIYKYMDRIPGAELFDGKIISADHLMLKPQTEIYRELYSRFNLVPAECFFIDDVPANIEGARLTGMDGTVFRHDILRLRSELRAAGIMVKESE
jgi:putative hydrolase of the HAD superfamily